MKPANPGSRRKRIIRYYFAGVVLPGIILGYMAFRGMRNDQAIREQDNLKKLETSSQVFFAEIHSDLRRFMGEQTSDSIFHGTKKFDPSILVILVRDSTGSKQLISHQLLYPPAEWLPDEPERLYPHANLKEGTRLEFAEQKYAEAIRFYQDRIQKTSDPEKKKEALVASARLYKRMNQPEKAKSAYEQIRKDYQGSLLNGQIPMALMADLEIMKINRVLGERREMNIHLKKSLERMLHPDCEYDADQFDMFFQSFQEISNAPDDAIDSLFARLEAARARTEFLIWLLEEPNLMAAVGDPYMGSLKNTAQGIPVSSGELQVMYLTTENMKGIQTEIIIDFQVFVDSIWEKLLGIIDPDSSINAKVKDGNGDPVFSRVLAEETGYLTFPFPENLPQWKLLLSENRPGFMATLLQAGSGIYLFAFILIALLMTLGFVFIMYTLNIELRLNTLQSEFISNVSHELKSPLTSIRMMTEMLHQRRVEAEAQKAEYYAAMLEESEHLSHLIDNILDFSRMEENRKKYDFVDLDLDTLTREFLKSIQEMIKMTGFEITYSCPDQVPVIRADRDAMLQVLYNLVDNAIKFSGASRKIDLDLAVQDREIQLSVKDHGMGISLTDQEKIFERFYRCRESQRSGIRGSGIGLTIVKKIVEDHGGRITLDSRPGEGSHFMVRLPIHET